MMTEQNENMVLLPKTAETAAAWVAENYINDAEFRSAFDKDPKAAVADLFGGEVPSGVEIKVHQNNEKCWHVTLPSSQEVTAMEDGDIASVAGGFLGDLIRIGQNRQGHTQHGVDPRIRARWGVAG